jgi:phage tail-like protein
MGVYGIDFYGTTFYGAPRYLEFDARPLVAKVDGYDTARVSWVNPTGDWNRLRLVRSSYGVPTHAEDGKILFESGSDGTSEFFDRDLKGGEFWYYSVWVRDSSSSEWFRAAESILLMPKDHKYGRKVFELMPMYFRYADYKISEQKGRGPLERYCEVVGSTLDHVRTEFDSLRWVRDPINVSGNLLPLLGNHLGVPHEPAIGMHQTRRWIQDAVYLYKWKGTLPGVEGVASAVTGWGARVGYSRNLLRGDEAPYWYGREGDVVDSTAPDNPLIETLMVEGGSSWEFSSAPAYSPIEPWFGIRVDEQTDYAGQAKVFCHSDPAGDYRLSLDWYDEAGEFETRTEGPVVTAESSNWVQLSVVANSGSSRYAALVVEKISGSQPCTANIKEVQLERGNFNSLWVPATAVVINLDPSRWNFVPNPSFNNGTFGWGTAYTEGSSYQELEDLGTYEDVENTFSSYEEIYAPSGDFIPGAGYVEDRPVTGRSGQSFVITGNVNTDKMGIATESVPHVFSFYAEGSSICDLTLNWFEHPDDEEPVFSVNQAFLVEGVNRIELSCTPPNGAVFMSASITGSIRIGDALFEEGNVAGGFFSGDNFGPDYIWSTIAGASPSKFFPGRRDRNARLIDLMPTFLPLNTKYIVNYVGGAPASGRIVSGDDPTFGVGTVGIMPFGQ